MSLPSTKLRRCVLAGVFAALLILILDNRSAADDFEPWLQSEKEAATVKLFANIKPNGAVIASPSKSDPDYDFVWVRDAALSMNPIISLYLLGSAADRSKYYPYLTRYIDFSHTLQTTINRSTKDGRGLGEPKFNDDGSPFTGSWGRPQDDGPALRALGLIRLANQLLDDNQPDQVTLVKSKLYDGQLPTSSVIKADLEYVSHNWQAKCIDLWEETSGHHFYTRLVQRKALIEGAKLADRLGDSGAAKWYRAQADALKTELAKHWFEPEGYIVVTLDRDDSSNYKYSGFDSCVILAVLHACTPDDDFFAPADDRVLATATRLSSTFKGMYDVNRKTTDDGGATLGVAIGRYPEDRYSANDGTRVGNPWFLCTNALGELNYRVANIWKGKNQVKLTGWNIKFLKSLNATKFANLQAGQILAGNDPLFSDILSELRTAGDAQLRRTKFHAGPDGSLSEQFNRHTGSMQSANDLTWSYASVLTALAQRSP